MSYNKKVEKPINLEETINKTAKETAKEVIQELRNNNYIKDNMSFFRRIEILLYNYSKLKAAVEQKEEDIKYIEQNGLPQKSGSIVVYQTGGGNITSQERYLQLIEKYNLEKLETEREVKRIDNALDNIRNDKYFQIIEIKYLNSDDKVSDEQLSEILGVDQSTITRNRKRLINSVKTILFPESIRDFV